MCVFIFIYYRNTWSVISLCSATSTWVLKSDVERKEKPIHKANNTHPIFIMMPVGNNELKGIDNVSTFNVYYMYT